MFTPQCPKIKISKCILRKWWKNSYLKIIQILEGMDVNKDTCANVQIQLEQAISIGMHLIRLQYNQ